MKHRLRLLTVLAVLFPWYSPVQIATSATAESDTGESPNVLVILTDDQGWGDLSLHGNTAIKTPRIDSLAKDGISFDRFFVCPVCSPTRAEFLTGRYHPRSGVRGVTAGDERMNTDEVTIADRFRDAGYATAMFGKWHNGSQSRYHPLRRGFEQFYGFTSGHWGSYFDPMLDHDGSIVTGKGYLSDDLTGHAIEFIKSQTTEAVAGKAKPFFAYVAYNTPHSPMQVPDRWFDPVRERQLLRDNRGAGKEKIEHTRAALAMCENLDWNIGRLLDQLEASNVARDTIVVFFCDNGPNGHRFNGDMRGTKGSTDEGGVRSPMFIRWPAKIQPGAVVKDIAGAIDLLPTLTAMANVAPEPSSDSPDAGKKSKPIDGRNLQPLITPDPYLNNLWGARYLFSHWGGRVSVRSQDYRLDHKGKLYNMVDDPGQRIDVSAEQSDVAQRMVAARDKWIADMKIKSPDWKQDPRPYLIDANPSVATHLPARDAKATGSIKRSSIHANCSYFTEWTDTTDSIHWPVAIDRTGDYELELYYACDDSAVGSTYSVVVEYDDGRISESPVIEIKTANPAKDRGAEHDRFPRTESYVKTWKFAKGAARLDAGKGTMRIMAKESPGGGLIGFRLLLIRRTAL